MDRLWPFQRRYRAGQRSPLTSGILSQSLLAAASGRTEIAPRSDQARRIDGRRLSSHSRKGISALPLYALKRLRAADAVSAQRRSDLAGAAGGSHASGTPLDRTEFLTDRASGIGSRRRSPPG